MIADEQTLAQLMALAQRGDRRAYTALLVEVRLWLERFFNRRCVPSQRDDLVQEVLIAVHNKRATYDADRPFLPWLAAIARYRWVDDLRAVKSLRMRDGVLLVIGAVVLTVIAIELLAGLWRGALTGDASAFFILTNGLLLILGCAGASSVLRMASPRVGNQHDGPRWASLAVAVLPLAALVTLLGHDHPTAALASAYGVKCTLAGTLASSLTAGVLFLWLRRGAPVSPNTAGLHLGIASTALGSAAFGLACPLDGTVHLGVWHVAPVVLGAAVGRFLVAPLLRW